MSPEAHPGLHPRDPFLRLHGAWRGVVTALEAIADRYDLKPALFAEIDPDVPEDMRRLPAPFSP